MHDQFNVTKTSILNQRFIYNCWTADVTSAYCLSIENMSMVIVYMIISRNYDYSKFMKLHVDLYVCHFIQGAIIVLMYVMQASRHQL